MMKIHRGPCLLVALVLLVGCGDGGGQAGDAAATMPVATEPAAAAEQPPSRGTIEEAAAMLDRAVAHYNDVGRAQALSDFTARAEPFVDRDLYVFCYGPDRTISAHGADAALVGVSVDSLRDVDRKAFGTRIMEVAQADPAGGTVDYKWLNPATRIIEDKVSVVKQVGTDVCGVGAYAAG
jgi:cytochrome c